MNLNRKPPISKVINLFHWKIAIQLLGYRGTITRRQEEDKEEDGEAVWNAEERERDREEGERKRRRTVQKGVREDRGMSVGCRESVRKISQLVELENM